MAKVTQAKRHSYAKLRSPADMPNLLDVQLKSFEQFLQLEIPPEKRAPQGLQKIFLEIFPISDIHENFSLEFVKYSVGTSRYTVRECQERNMTHSAPLKATLRLIARESEDKTKEVRDIIEQDVFLGELPLLTDQGTFIINGAERVIVSQLHRSPGVFFDDDIHPNGKRIFSARIIPFRGSWVEFSIDINDIMFVHIDSRRKIPVTTLLRALGFSSNEDILGQFYELEKTALTPKKLEKAIGRCVASDIVDTETGELILTAGDQLTEEIGQRLRELKIPSITLLKEAETRDIKVIPNTFKKDPTRSGEEALIKLYSQMRPGEPPNVEMAQGLVEKMFFSEKRYDLGEVGRYMINQRLGLDLPLDKVTLDIKDFIAIIDYLVRLKNGHGFVDDIDHLGNRRARSVGELLSNLFSVGLSRIARTIRERMSLKDNENIAPHDLVNARTVSAVVDTFFGSSQLSQFMDQINPLSELTHKRRLSALGPGGLTRERAGFEVRDVHHTHYGRVCPIETPEGPNIGLIASLATYARINKYGFLETPYRKCVKSRVTDEIVFLSADQEDKYVIAQANEPLDDKGGFVNQLITARFQSDYPVVAPEKIEYMDVSPKQVVSVAAALIPFLEHDDANRALMGSNMQRQAVPLLCTEPPLVGTGMEAAVARDSGASILAKNAGTVTYVDSVDIRIKPNKGSGEAGLGFVEEDEYSLIKFKRSNQDTCIGYKPIIDLGDEVEAGDVIADGPATHGGELALGYNATVAFMPWRGYNFEDAIIVSEELIHRDIFTSIHIEEFELQVRDTKRGSEEVTREIPNVSEDALSHLDERGIVRIGAEVEAGDILVGKVTPKGETELSPEERLLRAIFGEKAGDIRDASLKAPPGLKGVVIDTQVFSRKERTEEAKKIEKSEIAKLKKNFTAMTNEIARLRNEKVIKLLDGYTANTIRKSEDATVLIRSGHKFREDSLEGIDLEFAVAEDGWCQESRVNKKVEEVLAEADKLITTKRHQMENEVDKVVRGAELPPGVKQLVKARIAIRRKLAVGDKMAGRHGNKGVVAKILPLEDMPYMPDGTPVDVILNPLGVPSRMNVGQILETHLGWAAKTRKKFVSTPVFDGATLEEVKTELTEAGLPVSGKTVLNDGRTGQPFDNEVTVGSMYIMKLSHLVDDKIHARSIGPYSLVTQQPLGGKAQFGGQRFGEMEVWAMEAYGAAYALQEMLTVKSDDVQGRSKVYEAIVKGANPPEPGVPESFNVLVKELQALGLDVDLIEK
ncbi:MAG: DNA-directed RNA polymerase subunit beta [Candidatus Zixiibacteriota bacterium]